MSFFNLWLPRLLPMASWAGVSPLAFVHNSCLASSSLQGASMLRHGVEVAMKAEQVGGQPLREQPALWPTLQEAKSEHIGSAQPFLASLSVHH